jgi:hypothetical protein
MRVLAIFCGVFGVIVATAGPGVPETLNVSEGSSVDRTFFADEDTDVVFTMRNQGRTGVAACCFYVNRNGHCSDTAAQICFGRNSCGPRVTCIPGCTASDFRFEIPAKSKTFSGANVVQWSVQDGLVTLAIPPLNEIPFFGDLVCDMVGLEDECPAESPCQ